MHRSWSLPLPLKTTTFRTLPHQIAGYLVSCGWHIEVVSQADASWRASNLDYDPE